MTAKVKTERRVIGIIEVDSGTVVVGDPAYPLPRAAEGTPCINYAALPDGKICEFAIIVADETAGQSLGSRLMRCLMDAARQQGYTEIRGQVLPGNEAMLALMDSLDFIVRLTDDAEGTLEVSRSL